jgi:copper transport protein
VNRSRWAALLGLIAMVALLVLGTASPASAHATLIGTDPPEGAVLEEAPDEIGFTFSESVLAVPDSVQVFDAQGDPVEASASVSGRELDVALTEEVGDGTLVVVWRVVSEDGHPVTGSLSFSIGAPSTTVEPPPSGSADPTDAPLVLSLARAVGYVGMFLAAGLVAFAVLFVPAGALSDRAGRRMMTIARAGAGAAAVAWLVGLPITAVYQLGGGADSLTKGSTWSSLPLTEYAVAVAVVAGLAVAVGLPRGRMALAAAAVAVCAPALTGHSRAETPEWLVVGADMLHLLAGTVWLGGLVALVIVLPELVGRGTMAGDVLARFSGVAAGILLTLAATGVLMGWRILGAWGPLFDTTYGLLLLLKVGIAVAVVLVAAWNRWRLLPRLRQAVKARQQRVGARLVVRATAAEACLLLAVLLVTGLLVDKSPEPDAPASAPGTAQSGPQEAMLGDVKVVATLSPLTIGPNTVTIQLFDSAGAPTEFFEPPRARLSSDEVDLGNVAVTSDVAGTYTAEVVLPAPGTWRLQVSLRTSRFENPVAILEFRAD